MAQVTSKTQLEIYECKTDDGGVGLKFGDGPVFMGYDAGDLMRLLLAVFPDNTDPMDPQPIDGDLIDLAHKYLDSAFSAHERQHELDEAAGWREW